MAVFLELLIVPALLATLMGISVALSSLTLQAVLAMLAAIAFLVIAFSLINAMRRLRHPSVRGS
jgi:hypothetical protein